MPGKTAESVTGMDMRPSAFSVIEERLERAKMISLGATCADEGS